MQTFAVTIEGEGLEQVRDALNRAFIPTVGPPMDIRFATEPVAQAHEGQRMTAVVDADTAAAAEARVEDHLPAGDYEVRAAEPWPPELTS
jgi:hypothetical protein